MQEYERERDKDGDVLILSPKKPERRLPDFMFEKQIGRNDNDMSKHEDILPRDELVIEPNIDAIRKKKPYTVVDFNKQIGRPDLEKKDYQEDEYFI